MELISTAIMAGFVLDEVVRLVLSKECDGRWSEQERARRA
jgi:hypothetical protein